MNSFRLAMLASCIALPALAQEVPALEQDNANAMANARARNASAMANATATANATAVANANGTGSTAAQQVPRTMPPAVVSVSPDKPMTRKEAVGVTVAKGWIAKFQKPHLDENGVEHFISGKGQVSVVTAVDHITDIALAPDETIFPPLHVGADGLWHFHPALSRVNGKSISHVLVKPTDAGLSTNMVIETNKRTISVSLTSRQRDYMPMVSMDLPEDEDKEFAGYAAMLAGQKGATGQVDSPCDQTPTIPPDQFKIDGDNVAWRPTQVYQVSTPVGIKTCVDLPSSIGSQSLPALLALADDGGWFSSATKTIVNIRFVNRRFVVDEMLDRFVLVDGVGSAQKRVKITKKGL